MNDPQITLNSMFYYRPIPSVLLTPPPPPKKNPPIFALRLTISKVIANICFPLEVNVMKFQSFFFFNLLNFKF